LKNVNLLNEIVDYPLPDIAEPYRSGHFIEEVKAVHQRGLAAAGPLAQTLFETAWMIRGFEEFMIDMIENEDLAECLLDRMMELRIKAAVIYAKADVDVLMLGDDVAMQTGMLIDPDIWRKWLKPRMAKIIASAKSIKPDLNIFYHSDGNPEALINDLIEIGVNILNPIQPECMDPDSIKQKYGSKLAFWGAIGVQTNLPFGTPDDVAKEVKLRMETIGRNGGFIIGPSHMIEPEVPWENLVALYDAIDRFGIY
jgi:uroporphyrinogen decarboxylase